MFFLVFETRIECGMAYVSLPKYIFLHKGNGHRLHWLIGSHNVGCTWHEVAVEREAESPRKVNG